MSPAGIKPRLARAPARAPRPGPPGPPPGGLGRGTGRTGGTTGGMRARQLRIGRERPGRPLRRAANIIAAVCASLLLLGVLGFGYATIPALGPALDPGHGVWTSAAGGEPVRSQTLQLPGLRQPVTVTFTAQGAASISAASTHDLFLALGYVHARFRLSEMDEERRLGEGRLAQLAGPTDLASDKFELELGLLRTAEQEWAQMPKASPPAQALIDYAAGVNDDLAQVRASGQWPAVFSLPGVYPGPWTPVDSLVIQGELSQELDFTTSPLDYALLERSLGPARTMAWFPIIAKNAQTPYDPGPYAKPALIPLAPGAASTAHPQPEPAPGGRSAGGKHHGPFGHHLGRSAGGGHAAGPAQPAARRAAARIPGQQRVGRRRARGRGRRRPAGRGPAPAADAAVGLVRGRLVRAGPRRGRGQRAGPARDPHRAQRPYRLVADRHAEPGHLLLPRGDRQEQARPVLLGRGLAQRCRWCTTRSRCAAPRP